MERLQEPVVQPLNFDMRKQDHRSTQRMETMASSDYSSLSPEVGVERIYIPPTTEFGCLTSKPLYLSTENEDEEGEEEEEEEEEEDARMQDQSRERSTSFTDLTDETDEEGEEERSELEDEEVIMGNEEEEFAESPETDENVETANSSNRCDGIESTKENHRVSEEFIEVDSQASHMYECRICKVLVPERADLIQHLQDKHVKDADLPAVVSRIMCDPELFRIRTDLPLVPAPVIVEESWKPPSTKRKTPSEEKKKRRKIKMLMISCNYPGCGKTFSRRGALSTHQVVHEVSKQCPHCGFQLKTITALLRHVDRRHNVRKVVRIECPEPGCHRTLKNPAALKSHLRVHTKARVCHLCGTSFAAEEAARKHLDEVHFSRASDGGAHNSAHENHVDIVGDGLIMCATCRQSFSRGAIESHMQSACIGSGKLLCSNPRWGFDSATSRSSHERQMHRKEQLDSEGGEEGGGDQLTLPRDCEEVDSVGNTISYRCHHQGCGQRFEAAKDLGIHLTFTAHKDVAYVDKPFLCPYKVCILIFRDRQTLTNHMREAHWGTKKMKTLMAAQLAKEDRAHQRAIAQAQELASSVTVQETPVDAKLPPVPSPRKCPSCYEMFPGATSMKRHLRTVHGDEVAPVATGRESSSGVSAAVAAASRDEGLVFDLRMYKCPLCQAAYHMSNGLRYHLGKHHQNPEEAAGYLRQLDADAESFVTVVPSTLYGDSFTRKKRRRKTKTLTATREATKQDHGGKAQESQDSSSEYCESDSPNKSVDAMRTLSNGLDERESAANMKAEGESSQRKDSDDAVEEANLKAASKKNGKLMCRYPSCTAIFKSRFELLIHQRTHERLLRCPHTGCEQEFFNSKNMRLHIQLVHADKQVLKCPDCGMMGKRNYIVYRHPKFCPKSANLACPKCGRVFRKISSYTNHVRSHDKVPTANFTCEHSGCDKKFRTRQDRARHHNVHTGARPHVCPYAGCGKTYKQRPHLLVHLKNQHTVRPKEEPRPRFECEYCGTEFCQSSGRLKHIRKSCLQGPNREAILAAKREKQTRRQEQEAARHPPGWQPRRRNRPRKPSAQQAGESGDGSDSGISVPAQTADTGAPLPAAAVWGSTSLEPTDSCLSEAGPTRSGRRKRSVPRKVRLVTESDDEEEGEEQEQKGEKHV